MKTKDVCSTIIINSTLMLIVSKFIYNFQRAILLVRIALSYSDFTQYPKFKLLD